MATLNTLRTGSLIDAAFLAPSRPPRPGNRRFAAEQEQAMARRLQQLQKALDDKSGKAPLAPASPAASPTMPERRERSLARTLLACLLSAALGAGGTWLLMADLGAAPGEPGQPQAVRISPTAIASAEMAALATPVAPVALAAPDAAQVGELVEQWRQAWSGRDLAAYLDAYGAAFEPAIGSRDAWVAARTKKLATPGGIEVQLRDLVIEGWGEDRYKVSFLQDYASGSYRETGRAKTLQVARENGQWKIVREQQAP